MAEKTTNNVHEVFGVFMKRMKSQMDRRNYFCSCSYMTQTDLPEESQFSRVYFGAAIVTDDKYYEDEEEEYESLYMEN